MKIKQALEEFTLDCEAAGRSPHTVKIYKSVVTAFSGHCHKSLGDIVTQDVRDWMLSLRSRNAYQNAPQKPEQSEGLSPHTVANYARHMRGFFAWCVDIGYLDKSPMQGMKQPRPPKLKSRVQAAFCVLESGFIFCRDAGQPRQSNNQ